MKPFPTDIISLVLYLIDASIITISAGQAFDRLRNSITATAHKEGRDVTPEEQALIVRLEAESDTRRRGG